MALIADLSNIDLVVEPHAYTEEDLAAFRSAVEEYRQKIDISEAVDEALKIVAERMENQHVHNIQAP